LIGARDQRLLHALRIGLNLLLQQLILRARSTDDERHRAQQQRSDHQAHHRDAQLGVQGVQAALRLWCSSLSGSGGFADTSQSNQSVWRFSTSTVPV
jgi:hypothetical protein